MNDTNGMVPVDPAGHLTGQDALEHRRLREDQLRSRIVDLTGSPDGDTRLAALYDGYDDEESRGKAMEMYVKHDMSIDEIADKIGIPVRTVAAWAYVGKWTQAVMASVAVRLEDEAVNLARLRVKQRRLIVQKQLDSAQMVRDKIEEDLDNMSAKSAAEALKAVADVEARALGMSESGHTDFETAGAEARKAQKDKPPLVVIFRGSPTGTPKLGRTDGPSGSGDASHDTIDV